jgi:hypothetical protein
VEEVLVDVRWELFCNVENFENDFGYFLASVEEWKSWFVRVKMKTKKRFRSTFFSKVSLSNIFSETNCTIS